MATIQKRTSVHGTESYRVMVRRKGFPAQSATFVRRTDAKIWALQVEGDIERGRQVDHNEPQKHTIGQLADRYLEMMRAKKPHAYQKQKQIMGWWKERLGKHSVSYLTPARISELRDALLAPNPGRKAGSQLRMPATANRYLAALSKACSVAVRQWHWLRDNPVLRVQKQKEAPRLLRYLSAEEKDSLLVACGRSSIHELELIVVLALTTGMRRGEIKALRWPDVDLKHGAIVLRKTGSGEGRAVPIAAPALALLGKHAQTRRINTNLVFPQGDKDHPLDFDHAFIDAVRAAKIENFRFRDLRHTAASYLALSGATTAEITAVLGYRTLAMAKRYAHLNDRDALTVIERMTDKFFR